MNKAADLYARVQEIAERDINTALRLLLVRDMLFHRGLDIGSVADAMNCTKSWLYSLINGTAWYRISVPKLDGWFDQVEEAITVLSDEQGGVYGTCKCDPRSIEGIREVLSHSLA